MVPALSKTLLAALTFHNVCAYWTPLAIWSNQQSEWNTGFTLSDPSELIADKISSFLANEQTGNVLILLNDGSIKSQDFLIGVGAFGRSGVDVSMSSDVSSKILELLRAAKASEFHLYASPVKSSNSLIPLSSTHGTRVSVFSDLTAMLKQLEQSAGPQLAVWTAVEGNAVIERRLQAVIPDPLAVKEINMKPTQLAQLLWVVFFALVCLVGVSCLMSIDTPVQFEEKVLPVNREF